MKNILIYSKNTLYREILAKSINSLDCVDKVLSIENAESIVPVVKEITPDYLIVDFYSRNFEDDVIISAGKFLDSRNIILVTTIENKHLNYYYSLYGIHNFVYAEDRSENIMTSLLSIFTGEKPNGKPRSKDSVLTSRECEILKHISTGKTSKEIADMLCISKNTVDTHRNKMLQKLNLANSASLVHYAYISGLF